MRNHGVLQWLNAQMSQDPQDEARSVTKIGWHPEGPTKLVGSYSNLRFQRILVSKQFWRFLQYRLAEFMTHEMLGGAGRHASLNDQLPG